MRLLIMLLLLANLGLYAWRHWVHVEPLAEPWVMPGVPELELAPLLPPDAPQNDPPPDGAAQGDAADG